MDIKEREGKEEKADTRVGERKEKREEREQHWTMMVTCTVLCRNSQLLILPPHLLLLSLLLQT